MSYEVISHSKVRWDAKSKVTGQAPFTEDIPVNNLLYGKILRSTIAHGYVKEYDISEALKVPGVLKILLPEDLPSHKFSTAGHPYALDEKAQDIEDRTILTRQVRIYGDEIGAVVATSELAAEQALELIKVAYQEYPVYLTPEQALQSDAMEIHEGSKNIIKQTAFVDGDIHKGFAESDYVLEDEYSTQIVQHCHMESQVAYAYQDVDGRWTCVSSTQIPHICRRILGQAFGERWSNFRVKKPFIGGGFGNKQDVTIEPLVVAMSKACGGKPVMIKLSREESIAYTRTRHAISYKMKIGIKKDGTIKALQVECFSNNGGYASHGHAIAGKGAGFVSALYSIENLEYKANTIYTNVACAGAMRGYGIPQVMFAIESLIEKVIRTYRFDPIAYRMKHMTKEGAYNKPNNITQYNYKLIDCFKKGKEVFKWDEKSKDSLQHKTGDKRRGVGVAGFSYGSGTYPKGHEIASCRLSLSQDGTVKLMLGATEIGQGSDTVLMQMAAESLGIAFEDVRIEAVTDTDTAPFDTGSYASRQSYVTGMAVKKAALELKAKILDAAQKFKGVCSEFLDVVDGNVVYSHNHELIISLGDLALKTYYDLNGAQCLTSEVSNICFSNSYSAGATFAQVEVDIQTGKVEILSILNVHDSGVLLNPLLARGQVEGGMSMGIGFALAEELKYDLKGKPLNNNLLDYKFMTMMDLPDLESDFIESEDPFGPYGNKSLGEPPTCSPAPAIRNAVLDAIGVEFNHLPLSPQKIFEGCKHNGLI